MEQTSKYFTKTATALQNLNNNVSVLESAAEAELTAQAELKADKSMLKEAIEAKVQRIDNIIKTLNGALK